MAWIRKRWKKIVVGNKGYESNLLVAAVGGEHRDTKRVLLSERGAFRPSYSSPRYELTAGQCRRLIAELEEALIAIEYD